MNLNMYGNGITVRNVNEALPTGLQYLREHGIPAESRGMKTLRVPGPMMTVYLKPTERVLFNPVRDANPFFHLFEAMWILSGSRSIWLPKVFLNNIDRFSDDGASFHGAYGYRLRQHFGFDQIIRAVDTLRRTPDSRQVVLSIWDPKVDLGAATKDVPCNDMIMVDLVDNKLNMMVCNRSNDVIWGAYGANAVQFSVLQEYLAIALGAQVGIYTQLSYNYHVYLDNPFWQSFEGAPLGTPDATLYDYLIKDPNYGGLRPLAVNAMDLEVLYIDCVKLNVAAEQGVDLRDVELSSSFGKMVLTPAIHAYGAYKEKDYLSAIGIANSQIGAPDWSLAMAEWLHRRMVNAERKVVQA